MLAVLVAALLNAPVHVLYAGSLTTVMETQLAPALRGRTGLRFEGESKGSKALAHLIEAGLRTPDVFLSADPALIAGLNGGSGNGDVISGYAAFGSSPLVIAYAPNAPNAARFARTASTGRAIARLLRTPGVRVGRTDPRLDPKGARTARVLERLGISADPIPVFPEEDLAVRVQSGELDAGFFYTTETAALGLRVLPLPHALAAAGDAVYALGVLRHAPDPRAAHAFVNFILTGEGRTILEKAGVRYFTHPRIVGSV